MKKKVISSFVAMLIIFIILPLIFVKISKPYEFMGIMVFLFFVVNPITAAIINSMIGSDVKKMWWMPILLCIIFLLSYWLVLGEIILDLIFYSVFYLIIGIIFMCISLVITNKKKKRKKYLKRQK